MKNDSEVFDLTNPEHHYRVRSMAEKRMAKSTNYQDVSQPLNNNIFDHLAARMARSRLYIQTIPAEISIIVVMNLLGENNRLRQKSHDNPNGESSLQRKLEEIKWLTADSNIRIDLLYVSGTDWWGSEEALNSELIRLREIIQSSGINVSMIRTNDYENWLNRRANDKGGEWSLGLHLAANDLLEGTYDFLFITDADLMINLAASIGEGLMHHYEKNIQVIFGNRKDESSRLQKNSKRNGPGAGWYYYISRHLNRTFTDLGILDTQCPSKLFTKGAAQAIDKLIDTDTHGVDTDYLYALMTKDIDFTFTPLVAIDSEAESVSLRLPYNEAPDPAYRSHFIITGQIHQLRKYEGTLQLSHLSDSLKIAAIYENEIMSYDNECPWKGLSILLKSDLQKYHNLEPVEFTPHHISIDEFSHVIDIIFNS